LISGLSELKAEQPRLRTGDHHYHTLC